MAPWALEFICTNTLAAECTKQGGPLKKKHIKKVLNRIRYRYGTHQMFAIKTSRPVSHMPTPPPRTFAI